MRIAIGVTAVIVVAGGARADGKRTADVPAACQTWADDAARARTDTLRMGAELSLANCELEARVTAVTLGGDDKSLEALADAFAPSVAIFDQLERGSDPAYQILAAEAKGDLYDAMVVRVRNTGHGELEARVTAWTQAATVAYGDALRVAKQHPELAAANPVVASALQVCESRMQARRR